MENTIDVQPESSPVFEVPRDGAAYAEWRQTGKLPEAKPAQPKKEDSAPSKESSTGKQDQERQKPPRDNGATRLNEILFPGNHQTMTRALIARPLGLESHPYPVRGHSKNYFPQSNPHTTLYFQGS
jgi:hypothetical protein